MTDSTPLQRLAIEPEGILLDTLSLTTPNEVFYFRRRVPASFIEKMSLSEGLGIFFRYDLERQKANLIKIAGMELGNVVLVHTAKGEIAGYICMHPIDEYDRWYGLNEVDMSPNVYEFGAIEVSREWRGVGLSYRLMRAAFEGEEWLRDKIVTSYEFAWHWDSEAVGLNRFVYRKMLKRVIESGGFDQYDTDEPNVIMDAANMFMVRIGDKVSSEVQQKFFSLLQRNNPWGL
ncbi:MAG: GNAT family N-acetyltransferase [Chloroflexi bacterium]|uniref:GNAT family N-acetyltransferase n=1 Tax=Candidatus Chlorohelix allophototropha TaxID=3003348 RepID=A0A8T7M2Z4_9CHLR|nr:GNAT family N-acetyltransferase [Chloroflexota bacterium]WJW66985.1 GNAT family N-acetyltransferase [Chloroflexota bacterium L227-S17]